MRDEKDDRVQQALDELRSQFPRAWLDLSSRRTAGERVDSKDIRKHGNDVIRLSQLLRPETQAALTQRIAADFEAFLTALTVDDSYEPQELHIDVPLPEVLGRLRRTYAVPVA